MGMVRLPRPNRFTGDGEHYPIIRFLVAHPGAVDRKTPACPRTSSTHGVKPGIPLPQRLRAARTWASADHRTCRFQKLINKQAKSTYNHDHVCTRRAVIFLSVSNIHRAFTLNGRATCKQLGKAAANIVKKLNGSRFSAVVANTFH